MTGPGRVRHTGRGDLIVGDPKGARRGDLENLAALFDRAGVPCVVSEAVGSGADLIHANSTGAICKPGSAESLAGAIQSMLPLLKLPRTREACRQAVASYRIEDAAWGIADAFQSVLADRNAKEYGGARWSPAKP